MAKTNRSTPSNVNREVDSRDSSTTAAMSFSGAVWQILLSLSLPCDVMLV
jgi:hypothetical protein